MDQNIFPDNEFELRSAAVRHVQRVGSGGVISSEDLKAGFTFEGVRVPLINPGRGIFKPSQMRFLLSIRTVYPSKGRKVWYDDQRLVHEQIARGEELIEYAFMGENPEAADNRWLREAFEAQVPIIYFLGVAPKRYMPIWPTYIAEWSARELRARLAFSPSSTFTAPFVMPATPERRYGLRQVRQRLHQATFREAVLCAYDNRCAISGLPEPRLIDAAHIIADSDDDLGQPIVPNGLPLSKFHHAAFDAHLIGIDPDFTIHISPSLLDMNDGPMFEHGLKAMDGKKLRPPLRPMDAPDRDRLAQRFDLFRSQA